MIVYGYPVYDLFKNQGKIHAFNDINIKSKYTDIKSTCAPNLYSLFMLTVKKISRMVFCITM